jgi:hypothetical protein
MTTLTAIQNVQTEFILYLYNAGSLAPLTGVTFSDFTSFYARKPGGSPFTLTLDVTNFVEVDAVNLPGSYRLVLPSTVLDVLGQLYVYVPSLGGLGNAAVPLRVHVVAATPAVDLSSVTSTLSDIQGAGFDTAVNSLAVFGDAASSLLSDIETLITRVLGLCQENINIHSHVYDAEGNLTQSVLTLYPTRNDLILKSNPLSSYTMLASYDSEGRLDDYSVRKNP